MPATNAKEIVVWLMEKYPDQYKKGQIRTLQRRIAAWRKDQESQEEKLREIMLADSEC
jgi:predicted phosphoribosyltransferase